MVSLATRLEHIETALGGNSPCPGCPPWWIVEQAVSGLARAAPWPRCPVCGRPPDRTILLQLPPGGGGWRLARSHALRR